MNDKADPDVAERSNFLHDIISEDIKNGRFERSFRTRFPPEPNGYLHIGHAKAICLDFDLADEFAGTCNLRFDDTNPTTEDETYVEGIIDDLKWLGYEAENICYTSDYFEQLYAWAELLIIDGLAYIDDQSSVEISEQRGGFGKPGVESPFRSRNDDENLDLFRQMRDGVFPEGHCVLRARIDMQHDNMQMRDPVMYRIKHASHYRTGDRWCIYPTYDWAHGQGDAIEGITHSLCTLEFSNNRDLYNWFLEKLPLPNPAPYQTEFARLELTHTVTSKRKLRDLIDNGVVSSWDDPRLPTLRALKKRGYPASAIRSFCKDIGAARTNSRHAIELLESYVRVNLNAVSQRRMAILRPVKLIITNWPNDENGHPIVEWREVTNNPENELDGVRLVPFSGTLYIEQDDFQVNPPPKFFRLTPGAEVRLRSGYFITCNNFVENSSGELQEIHCTYDPATAGGKAPDNRKVKATLHWVSADHAVTGSVSLYDRLFTAELPGETTGDVMDDLNHQSVETLTNCKFEPALAETPTEVVVQFERLGYFSRDAGTPLLFHRTVGLRDEWANIQKRTKK